MSNKFDGDNFDKILGQAVKRHSEPVPADFTERMLSRVREAQEQRILTRVVLQERLSLAGSIVLGAAVLVLMTIFSGTVIAFLKSVAVSLTEQGRAFMDEVPQTVGAVRGDWQFYTIFAGILGFAVCGLADLLTANGER